MYQVLGIGIFIWIFFACIGQCGHQGDQSGRADAQNRMQSVRPATAAVRPVTTKANLISRHRAVAGGSIELIVAVSREFNVPAGALYGVWMTESSGLTAGWGQGWLLASVQVQSGSACDRHYGLDRCQKFWNALVAICGQRRQDGSAVCDPNQVRTSYALTMGPMQHLPTSLLVERHDGSYVWGSQAVDYDGDGVIDPHSLGDALASAARLLRQFYEAEGDWSRAVNRYYGSQTAGYFEGKSGAPGVAAYWQEWCDISGRCRQGDSRLVASR